MTLWNMRAQRVRSRVHSRGRLSGALSSRTSKALRPWAGGVRQVDPARAKTWNERHSGVPYGGATGFVTGHDREDWDRAEAAKARDVPASFKGAFFRADSACADSGAASGGPLEGPAGASNQRTLSAVPESTEVLIHLSHALYGGKVMDIRLLHDRVVLKRDERQLRAFAH